MFAVDRAAALQRSRRFLEAQYRLCKVGARVLSPGLLGAPRAARLPAPGFDYNPLVYGHVNERIPFFVFGHEFVERDEIPDCLWQGDHATMNCTQPEVWVPHEPDAEGGDPARRRGRGNASAAPPLMHSPVGWGCAPFNRSCGTAG